MFSSITKLGKSTLTKEFILLGLDFPYSRFKPSYNKIKYNVKKLKSNNLNQTPLSEYEKICGLDYPNSRFK